MDPMGYEKKPWKKPKKNMNETCKKQNMVVSENSVPLNPMVLLIIIPFLNG